MHDETTPDVDQRRLRDLKLQQAINALTRQCQGEPAPQIEARLRKTLRDLDLADQPATWLESVVSAISRGDPYVVSRFSGEHTSVPEPQSRPRNEVID